VFFFQFKNSVKNNIETKEKNENLEQLKAKMEKRKERKYLISKFLMCMCAFLSANCKEDYVFFLQRLFCPSKASFFKIFLKGKWELF